MFLLMKMGSEISSCMTSVWFAFLFHQLLNNHAFGFFQLIMAHDPSHHHPTLKPKLGLGVNQLTLHKLDMYKTLQIYLQLYKITNVHLGQITYISPDLHSSWIPCFSATLHQKPCHMSSSHILWTIAYGNQGTMYGTNIGNKPQQCCNNETSYYKQGRVGHSELVALLSCIHGAQWY